MKLRIIFTTILFYSFIVYAQTTNVPKSVMDAFQKLYPKVSDVKWEKEGSNNFEASFKDGLTAISVVLSTEGNLLETETDIELMDLPKGITSYVQQKYPGFQISETTKIIDSKDNLNYEIEITKDKEKKDLLFDKNASLIEKKEKESEQQEDEEDED